MAKTVSSKDYVDALSRKAKKDIEKSLPAPVRNAPAQASASTANDFLSRQKVIMGDSTSPGKKTNQSFMEKLSDPTSGPGKVVDVLSQPLYSAAQSAMEIKANIEDDGVASGLLSIVNPIDSDGLQGMGLIKNLGSRNDKKTVSDILRDTEYKDTQGQVRTTGINTLGANESDGFWNKAGKVGGSLALDIAGDPISYIPGAAIVSVGKGAAKAATMPVKLAQAAKEGTVVRTAGDAVAHAGTTVATSAGKASEKIAEQGAKFAGTKVGKPVTAVAKGTGKVAGTVLSPLHSIGQAIEKGAAKKLARELPSAVGEFSATAARLSPSGASNLERLMEESARRYDMEIELAETAAKNGTDVKAATEEFAEAVSDASKIEDGTFVPKFSSKVKTRQETAVHGPIEQTLTPRGKKSTAKNQQTYTDSLSKLLRRSKGEDDPLMYPKLADAPVPFSEVKRKTPTQAATENLVDDISIDAAAKMPEVEVPKIQETVAEVIKPQVGVGREELLRAAQAVGPKPYMGQPLIVHHAVAHAKSSEVRKAMRMIKNTDGSFRYPAAKRITDDDVLAEREVAQAAMASLEKQLQRHNAKLAGQTGPQAAPVTAQNQGTTGLAGEGAAPVPPKPDKPATISEKLAAKAEKTSADSSAKAADATPKPQFRRWSGATLNSWKKKLINEYGVHPQHIDQLLAAKTESDFRRKLTAMSKWKTDGPQYEITQRVLKATPPDEVADIAEGVVRAEDQILAGVAGEKTAAEIAEDAATPMSAETLRAFSNAIGAGPTTQNWTGISPDMRWRTAIENTLRNSPNIGEGYGVNRNAFNAKAQANAFQSFIQDASDEAGRLGLSGHSRQTFMKTFVMTGLDEGFSKLKSVGIQPTLGHGSSGIPFSAHDLLTALESSSLGQKLILGRVFDGFGVVKTDSVWKTVNGKRVRVSADVPNWAGTIKIDALMAAAKPLVSFLSDELSGIKSLDEAAAAISKIAKQGFPEEVIKAVKNEANSLPIETLVDGIRKDGTPGKIPGPVPKQAEENLVEQVTEALLDKATMKSIYQSVQNNAASAGIVAGQRVNAINEEAISAFVDIVRDPRNGTMSIAEALSPKGKKIIVDDAKKAVGDTNTPAHIDAAADDTYDEVMTEIISKGDMDAAKYLVDVSRAVEEGLRDTKGLALLHAQYKNVVSEGFHNLTTARLLSSGDNSLAAMNSWVGRILQPIASRFLNHWDNPTYHAALLTQGNVGRVYQGIFRRNLNDIAKQFKAGTAEGDAQLLQAFRMLQQGIPSEGTAFEAAVNALRGPLDTMFYQGGLKEGGAFSKFLDSGFDVDHVIARMTSGRNALPEGIVFDKKLAQEAAKKNGTTMEHELGKQWMSWGKDDPKFDPLLFLSKMNVVMGGVVTDTAIVMEGVRMAQGLNRASSVRRAGFTKYFGQEGSVFAAYVPKDMFFDADTIAEFRKMDEILAPSSRGSGKFSEFVDNVVSPITQHWKAGMTIYHAGHHIRNVIGDAAISYLQDGVKSPFYYARATRMLAGGHNIRRTYTAQNALDAMHEVSTAMTGGKHAAKVKIGRNIEVLDDARVQQLAMEKGILPDFNVQEDILDTARGEGVGAGFAPWAEKTLSKPFKGKVRKVAGAASEYRDDWVRMAHFMHVLENHPKNLKTLEEVVDWAAGRVRKAHPDGSDLTKFERGVLRLVFPFYSWTRKAIPLIVENMLLHPGRTMVYPKAMYAIAQTNGLDLESMSSPFPEDAMLPSFLRDNMTGPLFSTDEGNLIGMDFGFPQADILNDFAGSQGPIGGFASMLNPLVKVPIEMSTGSRLVADSKINDDTEYLESQVPGVAQLGQLTGFSPIGSAIDVAKGEGLRKQTSVEKGNKSALGEGSGPLGFDTESLANRTLNLRYTDMSKPSYRNMAEIEMRDSKAKAREEALKQMGR